LSDSSKGRLTSTHNDGSGSQTDAGSTTCQLQEPGGAGPATDLQLVCSTTGTNNTAGASQLQAIKVAALHVSN
jgi:hypothetical protein